MPPAELCNAFQSNNAGNFAQLLFPLHLLKLETGKRPHLSIRECSAKWWKVWCPLLCFSFQSVLCLSSFKKGVCSLEDYEFCQTEENNNKIVKYYYTQSPNSKSQLLQMLITYATRDVLFIFYYFNGVFVALPIHPWPLPLLNIRLLKNFISYRHEMAG